MKYIITNIFKKLGVDIKRYPNIHQRRKLKLFKKYNISLVLDVGANVGQYGKEIRDLGYKGKIISFEPLSNEFQILNTLTKKHKEWRAINVALGDIDGELEINVSEMSVTSSILDVSNNYMNEAYSNAHVIGKEIVKTMTLDTFFNKEQSLLNENIFLKLDAQGYEDKIIFGAKKSLANVMGIQIEMSIVELYKGEILFKEMLEKLNNLGFGLIDIKQGFYDPKTLDLYQIDGLFFRK
ncbi:FkbM family methyltransferase [Arundinibacter roseus]|uniref:FkbM family methyltransferase n=1 Tax=Arundinibacter roseus TaxID=2070510 RepID=A0A4R4JVN5_9BACT|nr:FkbM family methyltransferase [Arundinibacter roseus]TDB58643.1 FkbM family methyltransferase [Arundinibacter roseus]